MQIRRNDVEMLRKQFNSGQPGGKGSKGNGSGGDDAEQGNADLDSDSLLIINRDKCIPVVKGLMSLILSMDFTCNVDLFLVACTVCIKYSCVNLLTLLNHKKGEGYTEFFQSRTSKWIALNMRTHCYFRIKFLCYWSHLVNLGMVKMHHHGFR